MMLKFSEFQSYPRAKFLYLFSSNSKVRKMIFLSIKGGNIWHYQALPNKFSLLTPPPTHAWDMGVFPSIYHYKYESNPPNFSFREKHKHFLNLFPFLFLLLSLPYLPISLFFPSKMEKMRCCGNLLESSKPYFAMISLQFGYAGMSIITKVSLNRGMSHYVLVVYRHAFATAVIAPFALIFERFINTIQIQHIWQLRSIHTNIYWILLCFFTGEGNQR